MTKDKRPIVINHDTLLPVTVEEIYPQKFTTPPKPQKTEEELYLEKRMRHAIILGKTVEYSLKAVAAVFFVLLWAFIAQHKDFMDAWHRIFGR